MRDIAFIPNTAPFVMGSSLPVETSQNKREREESNKAKQAFGKARLGFTDFSKSTRIITPWQQETYPQLGRLLKESDIGEPILRVCPTIYPKGVLDWSYFIGKGGIKRAERCPMTLLVIKDDHFKSKDFMTELEIEHSNDGKWCTLKEFKEYIRLNSPEADRVKTEAPSSHPPSVSLRGVSLPLSQIPPSSLSPISASEPRSHKRLPVLSRGLIFLITVVALAILIPVVRRTRASVMRFDPRSDLLQPWFNNKLPPMSSSSIFSETDMLFETWNHFIQHASSTQVTQIKKVALNNPTSFSLWMNCLDTLKKKQWGDYVSRGQDYVTTIDDLPYYGLSTSISKETVHLFSETDSLSFPSLKEITHRFTLEFPSLYKGQFELVYDLLSNKLRMQAKFIDLPQESKDIISEWIKIFQRGGVFSVDPSAEVLSFSSEITSVVRFSKILDDFSSFLLNAQNATPPKPLRKVFGQSFERWKGEPEIGALARASLESPLLIPFKIFGCAFKPEKSHIFFDTASKWLAYGNPSEREYAFSFFENIIRIGVVDQAILRALFEALTFNEQALDLFDLLFETNWGFKQGLTDKNPVISTTLVPGNWRDEYQAWAVQQTLHLAFEAIHCDDSVIIARGNRLLHGLMKYGWGIQEVLEDTAALIRDRDPVKVLHCVSMLKNFNQTRQRTGSLRNNQGDVYSSSLRKCNSGSRISCSNSHRGVDCTEFFRFHHCRNFRKSP